MKRHEPLKLTGHSLKLAKAVRRQATHALDGYEPFHQFWFCTCGHTDGDINSMLEHINKKRHPRGQGARR